MRPVPPARQPIAGVPERRWGVTLEITLRQQRDRDENYSDHDHPDHDQNRPAFVTRCIIARRHHKDYGEGFSNRLPHRTRRGEQLRRPLLFSGSLLSAVALVDELLLGPRPHRLAAPARGDAALAVGGLGGGAGAGGSLERGALTEPLAHLGGGQPIPAAADAPAGEAAVQLLGDRVGVAPLGVGARARGRSIPATRRSEAGLRPRRGRGGDGLLAREGDNPLGDLGPPIVELAVE
jgi:hypothetical protein